MTDLLLGVDLGTTSVKAGLFAPDGACVAHFRQTYPTSRAAGGAVEQDTGHWIGLIDAALDRFGGLGFAGRVGAGALTSQVNTHVFVNAAGVPLMPAMTWQDTRAAREAAELDAQLGLADKVAWLGAPIPVDASHPLARMLWVQRHRPEVWEKTAHVLLPKDLALLHLTGALATDPLSNIGLVGLDGAYVAPILDLVSGAAERLAPLSGLCQTVGSLRDARFRKTPMATATMDAWVGLVGTGACRDGAGVYLSGTSEILGITAQTVTQAPGIVVFAEAEGLRLHAGPTQSGGASLQWFADLAGLSLAEVSLRASSAQRRAAPPLFLPQLAGERAPLWNAALRGAFLGLETTNTSADLARAVLEGVALSARHVMQALDASAACRPDTLACGGGGFRSELWGQIRADVLGRRLERLETVDTGLVGAACLAAVASGQAPDLTAAQAPFRRIDRVWEPDPARRGAYDDLFGLYLEAVGTLETLQGRLSALSG